MPEVIDSEKTFTSTGFISTTARCEPNQSLTDSRLVRWQLQRTAQALLPRERVAFCMRRIQASTVDVLYCPDNQSAHYSGLMVCGSIWVCPICAAKISERRRSELERAIERCIANGGAVYLVTYTISHKRYDSLSTLLQSFLSARRRMRQGRAAQEFRKKFGILGTVSVREVTWSKQNGWHPHCHELVFCSSEIDVEAYDKAAREQWERSVEHEALSINEHGFNLSRTYGSVADYVAKFGKEPLRTPWGAATELTKGHLKQGRSEEYEHLTPFAMLWLISQGRDELKPIFWEYAQWFKGKHQLVWSAGLRSLLLDNAQELTDEELAQEEEHEVIVLGTITQTQWRIVLANDARGELLEVARSGDWRNVRAFLVALGANCGPSPPLLGLLTIFASISSPAGVLAPL